MAIQFGLKENVFNVVTACATGTHSIGEAFRSIQYGEADVMVAGGTEASIAPIGVAGFTSLDCSYYGDRTRCALPFLSIRTEAVLLWERVPVLSFWSLLEHALARNASIYAEVIGYGSTCDAYHITSPAEDGSGSCQSDGECHK